MEQSDARQIVLSALSDLLASEGQGLPETAGEAPALIGRAAVLDSFGLVNLILDVEQRLQVECGVSVVLADERAMSQKHSPFLTVDTLASYICRLLNGVPSNA